MRRTLPRAPRCSCTARSATPRSTTCRCGSSRSVRSSPPGAPRPSSVPACSSRSTGASMAEPDSRLRWSAEQEELASMLSSLLAKHSDSVAVRSAIDSPRGYDEKLWSMLCEQVGVTALSIPEKYGGAGFSFLETAVVLEQLGQALTPSPMLATFVATSAMLHSGDDDACSRLLPTIAGGAVSTLAWSGPSGMAGGEEPVSEDDGRLTGSVRYV